MKITFGDTVITKEGQVGKVTELDPETLYDTKVTFDKSETSSWYPHRELSLYDLENDHDN